MKVLISGYYGFGNVGDESVLQALVSGLKEIDPDIGITVLSAAPKITKELNKVEAVNRYNWFRLLVKMLKTNVFISGGGTLFQNITSTKSFVYYVGLVLLAKLMFKKVAVIGQGFGPLQGRFNRFLAKFALNRANLITLRDSASYEELKRLGVRNRNIFVTADPTAMLKLPLLQEGRKILSLEAVRLGKPLLGVAVRNVPRQDEERLYQTLSATLDWLAKERNLSPVFILFQCPEDMGETSKVINYMEQKSNVIFRICRPDEMLSLIANFDLLIGMRLHSLIFAAMNQVPMLGLSYDPKVDAFMKEIGQPYFPATGDLAPESLRSALERILSNRDAVRQQLSESKKRLHQQAEQNFSLFFEHFARNKEKAETAVNVSD
ncbi:MAG: polysaccharide pyruvyl transferase CsaB [Candidatus Saganbacteria bacterium]|nr:polysaccharide pyruvyl transferase CsaB [Candidatus Saganbacteria bacterium]